ncbi:hypothetical protein ACFS5J_06730 [Flavobacterium chuncheonense]|uniref:Uncharacterized protein n=1 Tax=Flavobacterium chuncheonense TaxID=2026653 RepID=A0ABW5YM88_9FLAO
MSAIIIGIILIVIYFIITAIKENETREAVQRERSNSNKKIANMHFENLVQNEINKTTILNEAHKNFIKELENEPYIKEAHINHDVLNIIMNQFLYEQDAQDFADNLISSLNNTTGINIINIFDSNKIGIASAKRNKF